ncbi:MAG: signal recognition particle receptor subunit alpha, partial [Oricola sp.]|nr:signal recognition particle receptor subunit alpha [Oricola sp.]
MFGKKQQQEALEEEAAPAEAPQAPAEEASAPEPAEPVETAPEKKKGWLSRLRDGLSKSSNKLTEGVSAIFTKRKLDDETLEELTDLLITADLGVPAATRITDALARE